MLNQHLMDPHKGSQFGTQVGVKSEIGPRLAEANPHRYQQGAERVVGAI
jgi:hypothetical protein